MPDDTVPTDPNTTPTDPTTPPPAPPPPETIEEMLVEIRADSAALDAKIDQAIASLGSLK